MAPEQRQGPMPTAQPKPAEAGASTASPRIHSGVAQPASALRRTRTNYLQSKRGQAQRPVRTPCFKGLCRKRGQRALVPAFPFSQNVLI